MEILKALPANYQKFMLSDYSTSFSLSSTHLRYSIHYDLHKREISFLCDEIEVYRTNTTQGIIDFIGKIEKEVEAMTKLENEIASYFSELDITSYSNHHNFYVFGERVPFHIEKVFQSGKERYRSRFGASYNVNLDLGKLATIVRKKAIDYVQKRRVKAVMNGKSRDVFPKFLYKVFGSHVENIRHRFQHEFITKLTYDEVNEQLLPIIDEAKAETLTKDYLAFFRYHLRTKKHNFIINKGFRFGHVFLFVSPTRYFIITKDELDQVDLSTYKWRKEEDKTMTKELTERYQKDLL